MSADLAILVPVLDRPGNVAPLMESIRATTPDARTIFVCDPDDLDEQRAVVEAEAEFFLIAGSYACKINGAIKGTQEPLIFTGADDLTFHPGWFEAAEAKLTNGVGVVGTQDCCNPRTIRGEHATHFLVARAYSERGQIDGQPGLLSETYAHCAVDDELIATATARGAYAFADDAVVEHHHPMNGTAPDDATYRKGLASLRADQRLFRQRSALWT